MQDQEEASNGHLLRVLGLAFGIAICVGSVIGGGILRTPGSVVERVGEPWLILLLWALGGAHALLGANVVAELTLSVPKAGGLYVPTRRAFGDFAGMLVGWSDWLVNAAAAAALALVFADFSVLIHAGLEPHKPALALSVLIVLFALNWLGVREGSLAQKVSSLAKVILLIALVAILFLLVPPAPQHPTPTSGAGFSLLTLVVAYQLIYGVFSGWPFPIFFVEEDRNPAVNIPRAMFVSLIAITLVYVLINAALLHALPIGALKSAELPAATALALLFGEASTGLVAVMALIIVASCINSAIMGAPRILYGLARDGLFLPAGMHVNRGGTPDFALLMTAAMMMFLTLTGTFETVFLLMGALLVFLMIISEASLFALRIREPDLPRPYRARFYPWLPALLVLIDSLLLVAVLVADPMSGLYMFLLVALVLPVWLLLRRHRLKALAAG